jgi:hypothetical protein
MEKLGFLLLAEMPHSEKKKHPPALTGQSKMGCHKVVKKNPPVGVVVVKVLGILIGHQLSSMLVWQPLPSLMDPHPKLVVVLWTLNLDQRIPIFS